MLALTAGLALSASANIDRTGRSSGGHPRAKLNQGVKYLSVQVGGKESRDVCAKWEKNLGVGPLRTHLTAEFKHPNGENPLESVSVSGYVADVSYEATRTLSEKESGTAVQLSYSAPGGVQLTANGVVHGVVDGKVDVETLSAFHVAGPVNVQTSWMPLSERLRVKIGRGGTRHRCPISLQTEFEPKAAEPVATASYQVGMRHEFGYGRKLRGRIQLPAGGSDGLIWTEYMDSRVDPRATWFAKASMPVTRSVSADERPGFERVTLSLRRAWQW